jgi:hypothetical protein
MPMSIHRDASGALTVSFPVCQGDRVSNAGVGAEVAGEFVVLRYGPAPERQKASSVETFVVDDASVAADRLDVPWPLSKTWPEASVPDVNAITTVWARTNVKAAGFDVDTLLPEGQSDWLVTGDRILHDAVPVAMSNYDAKAVVDAFCDK